jgi:hypothetical protein
MHDTLTATAGHTDYYCTTHWLLLYDTLTALHDTLTATARHTDCYCTTHWLLSTTQWLLCTKHCLLSTTHWLLLQDTLTSLHDTLTTTARHTDCYCSTHWLVSTTPWLLSTTPWLLCTTHWLLLHDTMTALNDTLPALHDTLTALNDTLAATAPCKCWKVRPCFSSADRDIQPATALSSSVPKQQTVEDGGMFAVGTSRHNWWPFCWLNEGMKGSRRLASETYARAFVTRGLFPACVMCLADNSTWL